MRFSVQIECLDNLIDLNYILRHIGRGSRDTVPVKKIFGMADPSATKYFRDAARASEPMPFNGAVESKLLRVAKFFISL